MDAQPRISLSPAPLPSLSTASSSGSFPIRAPPTPDDDEASDLDSNDFHDSTNSNCSDIYSNSSSYNGFESGEDYEMALQETFSSEKDDDDSDQDLFVRPFVAESASDDDIAEESGNVDNNRFFRPFVVYPGDEIVEDDGKNRVFRPFIANPDKDRLFRPFVVDPDDQIVENVLENQLCRPFVADLDKEPMEENCCIDEDQGFSYAAESDEDDADDEICSNLEIKAKDNADSNRFISMPIARLSLEENVSESSVRTVDGSVVETVSIQQFDPLETESSDQSPAEKDAKEVDFSESVTDIASIDDNTEKSSNRISDDDEDAKSTETASQENEIDDVSQLNPVEEHEDPLNSSSFFNFMDLNPDSWPTAEHPLLETVLCSSEKARLENLQLLKVQFLRSIHKLGYSAEDPTAAHVLNLLDLTANSSSVQQIAIEIDAIEKKRLDFSLNILVLGKSGVGKSSTINSIFQEQKVEIHPFEPGTRTVTEVVGILKNGITVRIFDTPGLKQSAKEQHFNRKTLASVKKLMTDFRIDAVLYIDRLDSYDDSSNDLPLLQTISDSLGVSIWQKVGVVFTHASLEVPPLRYRDFVSWRQSTIQRCGCVVNPDSILLVENNNACEKSRDRILLFCSSVKTMNEARSSLGVSGGWKWRGDTKVSVDFRSRFGSVVRLDVKRRNWKITVGASLIGCRQGL